MKKTKGKQYPEELILELVKLNNGLEVFIGSKIEDGKKVIGMFYPAKGARIISYSSSDMKAIVDIIKK